MEIFTFGMDHLGMMLDKLSDPRETPALREQQAPQGHKGYKAFKVFKETPALRDLKEFKETLDHRAYKEFRETLDQLDRQDQLAPKETIM
jgi:hypothetical protein